MASRSPRKQKTVTDYLDALDDDKRAGLERLRTSIRKVLPRAEEVISYGMPGFRVDGRVVVWMGVGKDHCAFYPGAAAQEFADELEGFVISKGTVRFAPDEKIPATMVRKLIAARLAALDAARKPKRSTKAR